MSSSDPDAFNAAIEALTAALEETSDAEAQRCARELVSLILQFHREGVGRMLDILRSAPDTWQQRFEGDPLVSSLLALHEIPTSDNGRTVTAIDSSTQLIQIRRGSNPQDAGDVSAHGHDRTRCEQCGELLSETHHHVIDLVARTLFCCCRACWLTAGAAHGTSRKAVPDRYVAREGFRVTEAQWDLLQVPVDVVFFMANSTAGRTIAFYPSPAGATESTIALEAWRDFERANPWVRDAAPDVEAVLVRRTGVAGQEYEAFIVPIDACYDLIGRLRVQWRGFSGGDRARLELDRFFSEVVARSDAVTERR
jgi:hypothetical protein